MSSDLIPKSESPEAASPIVEANWHRLKSGRVVQVSVTGTGNPWIDFFGRSANDPDFDEYLDEMRRARSANGAD
jgi:hypothetical protein